MAGPEIVHVAMAASHAFETNVIKKVAAIVGKDLHGTRLLLAGEIPRIIAHYDTMQMAESTSQSLRALGVLAIVCAPYGPLESKATESQWLNQEHSHFLASFEGSVRCQLHRAAQEAQRHLRHTVVVAVRLV